MLLTTCIGPIRKKHIYFCLWQSIYSHIWWQVDKAKSVTFFVVQNTLGFYQGKTFSTLREASTFYSYLYSYLYEFLSRRFAIRALLLLFFCVYNGDKCLSTSSFIVLLMIFSIMACPVNKKTWSSSIYYIMVQIQAMYLLQRLPCFWKSLNQSSASEINCQFRDKTNDTKITYVALYSCIDVLWNETHGK